MSDQLLKQMECEVQNSGTTLASDLRDEQQVDFTEQTVPVQQTASVSRASISTMELGWLLWNNRRLLFRNCFWGLLIVTVIAFSIPKRYTATAQLMPPDYNATSLMSVALPAMSAQGGSGGGSVMGLASQLLGMNSSSDLFIGVLRSQTVEDRLIRRFKFQELYSIRHIEDARARLEASTVIELDKKTGILSISVEDRDPQRAAAIAQAYVDELNATLAEVNTSSAHRERLFIEDRLKQVKQELDSSSREFSIFASQNSAINLPDQAKAMVEAAAELQAQLIAAQSELKAVEAIFTDRNVRVKEAKARVSELQAQLEKFGGKNVDPSRDGSLAKGDLYPSIRQLPLLGVKYLDLYRRNKVAETVYELLTRQYELAKIQEAREIPSVQVLDPALVPTKKSHPHRLQLMLSGLFFTFAVSSAWLIARMMWQRIDHDDPRCVFVLTIYHEILDKTWDSPWIARVRGAVANGKKTRHSESSGERPVEDFSNPVSDPSSE